jgi:hypothetical protein
VCEGSGELHVGNSSLLGLHGHSSLAEFVKISASSTVWQGEYFCSSGNFGPSSISREIDKFLAVAKICSSREGEILTAARI